MFIYVQQEVKTKTQKSYTRRENWLRMLGKSEPAGVNVQVRFDMKF